MNDSESQSRRGLTVPIVLEADQPDSVGPRYREPVTVGIPIPRGRLFPGAAVRLIDDAEAHRPVQLRILEKWSDGSIRWLLVDFQADLDGRCSQYLLADASSVAPAPDHWKPLTVTQDERCVVLDTGAATFVVDPSCFPFARVECSGRQIINGHHTSFELEDSSGTTRSATIDSVVIEETGPLRVCLRAEGRFESAEASPLLMTVRLNFFSGSPCVRFSVTLRNRRRARHPGGAWELGDAGSIEFRDFSFRIARHDDAEAWRIRCSPKPGTDLEPRDPPFELYQDSSGGARWNSRNHVSKGGRVAPAFCGYRAGSGAAEATGDRATPVVVLQSRLSNVALSMQHFWQNCPKAINATDSELCLGLFPRQYSVMHELQGGEQKTHTFTVAFGVDPVTTLPLEWCRQPLFARLEPSWYCEADAMSYLVPREKGPATSYHSLVDQAIEGTETFEQKRERIDEFGWRNFGDIYADHEASHQRNGDCLISHYNNQYDAVAGFAIQFFRTGDRRWWTQMCELASHVYDIDIYHTSEDKSAYNNGLFWHTYHYKDAGLSTHRSYPRADGVFGGGPSSEHCYSTGLLLHHCLTGDPMSRETVIGLGTWVIDMDDGSRTVFRWLARGNTGHASSSASPDYHGPGRGSGNPVVVLVNASRMAGDSPFLSKAEALIRRCIHPHDSVDQRNLFNVEQRWTYTIFLQALGRYLDHKWQRDELDCMYGYARESLLQYARWMADHEYPYLEKPERLEYPTETWAAQEMRKSDVFKLAALYATVEDRTRYVERSEYFYANAVQTLSNMPSRTLTRPVVIMLVCGYMHEWFAHYSDARRP